MAETSGILGLYDCCQSLEYIHMTNGRKIIHSGTLANSIVVFVNPHMLLYCRHCSWNVYDIGEPD